MLKVKRLKLFFCISTVLRRCTAASVPSRFASDRKPSIQNRMGPRARTDVAELAYHLLLRGWRFQCRATHGLHTLTEVCGFFGSRRRKGERERKEEK